MTQIYCLHDKASVKFYIVQMQQGYRLPARYLLSVVLSKLTRDIACMARYLFSVVLSKWTTYFACMVRYLLIVVLSK